MNFKPVKSIRSRYVEGNLQEGYIYVPYILTNHTTMLGFINKEIQEHRELQLKKLLDFC